MWLYIYNQGDQCHIKKLSLFKMLRFQRLHTLFSKQIQSNLLQNRKFGEEFITPTFIQMLHNLEGEVSKN